MRLQGEEVKVGGFLKQMKNTHRHTCCGQREVDGGGCQGWVKARRRVPCPAQECGSCRYFNLLKSQQMHLGTGWVCTE
ncbi:hypothetical protein PAMP_015591 [Pampus punctatissimus]